MSSQTHPVASTLILAVPTDLSPSVPEPGPDGSADATGTKVDAIEQGALPQPSPQPPIAQKAAHPEHSKEPPLVPDERVAAESPAAPSPAEVTAPLGLMRERSTNESVGSGTMIMSPRTARHAVGPSAPAGPAAAQTAAFGTPILSRPSAEPPLQSPLPSRSSAAPGPLHSAHTPSAPVSEYTANVQLAAFLPKRRPWAWVLASVCVFFAVLAGAAAVMQVSSSAKSRWLAPMMLPSTDARVLEVAATLRRETSRRNELSELQSTLQTRLREVERSIQFEESFQVSHPLGASPVADRARSGRSTALALRQEHDASLLAMGKHREQAARIRMSLVETEASLKENDELLTALRQSPYAAAVSGDVILGFLPHENRAAIGVGDPLVACTFGVLVCRRVGRVGERLAGAAKGTSSTDGERQQHGQLVRLDLEDKSALERSVLYVEPSSP